jgi:peptidoglycan/LPS O-acetylase OafA/YrhL
MVLGWNGAAATPVPGWVEAVFGDPRQDARLLGAFMTGACFWLWRRSLPLKGLCAAVAAAALCGLAFSPQLAEPALVLLGGYVLFWVCFKVRWKPLLTINARDDISYGTYLYAWPIGALLLWHWRTLSALDLTLLTLPCALAAGAVSWFLIERPALARKPRGGSAPGRGAPAINITTSDVPAEGARQQA